MFDLISGAFILDLMANRCLQMVRFRQHACCVCDLLVGYNGRWNTSGRLWLVRAGQGI